MPLDNLEPGDQFDVVEEKIDAAIAALNEFDGGTTDQVFVKTDNDDFEFTAKNSYLPGAGISGCIKIKRVNIGDWNMDSSLNTDVAHGVSNFKDILKVECMIRNDNDTEYYMIGAMNGSGVAGGAVGSIGATLISLVRSTSGPFDSGSFDSTTYNRGWLTITYIG